MMKDYNSSSKQELKEASEKYKEEILNGLRSVGNNVSESGKNALIIGGSLFAGYLVYKALSSKGKKKSKAAQSSARQEVVQGTYQEEEPSILDKMTTKLMEQAVLFLLTIAKEQLMLFLEKQFNKDASQKDN